MTESAPCVRCGHGPDDHRLRDEDSPLDDGVEFRCVVEECSCRDYVDEPLSARKKT